MPVPFVIAIDGYSSCGKSTLARALADELGFVYVDSGAMYRAVTFYFIEKNIELQDRAAVKQALEQVDISLKTNREGSRVFLNGRDISREIRQMPVSNLVSEVSAIPEVRHKMVQLQQAMGQKENLVMDGRDIGTVVFPEAPFKVFMTARPQIRARRRFDELRARGLDISFEQVYDNLLKRDHDDTTRAESPLVKAPDALELDNSFMSRREQLAWIVEKVKKRL